MALTTYSYNLIKQQQDMLRNIMRLTEELDGQIERWHREDIAALIETVLPWEFAKLIVIAAGDKYLPLTQFGNFIPGHYSEYDKIVADIQSGIMQEIARLDAKIAARNSRP